MAGSDQPNALYLVDGDRFVPTEVTTGPWRTDAQHGSPPAALLGHCVERTLDRDQVVARLTVELLKPVPLRPLEAAVRTESTSRRVAHARAELSTGEAVVARATALVLRAGDVPDPDWAPTEPASCPDESATVNPPGWAVGDDAVAYHRDGAEFRFVVGAFDRPSPADVWIRPRPVVVDGHGLSPLERVLAVADFASGVSAVYEPESGVGMINADLTVAFTRPLIGEWVHLEVATRIGPQGVGLCVAQIGDEQGHVGVATQSLVGIRTGFDHR